MAMGSQLGASTAELILYDDPARYGFACGKCGLIHSGASGGRREAGDLPYRVLDKFGR